MADSAAAPDPAEAIARIQAETGINLLDPSGDDAAAKAVSQRLRHQLVGSAGGLLLLAVALVLIGMAATDTDDFGTGGRVALGILGAAVAVGAIWALLWAWRLPAAYREVYLPRRAAQHQFLAETGHPWNPLGETDRLTRAALIAYSTPAEVREMKAAERAAQEHEKENDA